MTAVALPPPASEPAPHATAETGPLRFAMMPVSVPSGLLDGAWWPYSDDLEHELPFLVAALDRDWGRITRITVNPLHWRPLPHTVHVNGRVVKVGWFTGEQDPHKILLLSYGVGRLDLLTIPPRTSQAAAARLMAAATAPTGTRTASALIAENSRADTGEDPDSPPEDVELATA
jgi:hypothetical protein